VRPLSRVPGHPATLESFVVQIRGRVLVHDPADALLVAALLLDPGGRAAHERLDRARGLGLGFPEAGGAEKL
jgi:hypothetical protein